MVKHSKKVNDINNLNKEGVPNMIRLCIEIKEAYGII
jgi:hypothetical protein